MTTSKPFDSLQICFPLSTVRQPAGWRGGPWKEAVVGGARLPGRYSLRSFALGYFLIALRRGRWSFLNGPGKVGFGDFDQQMIVIGHQYVGVQAHPKKAHRLLEPLQEMAPVPVIAENIATNSNFRLALSGTVTVPLGSIVTSRFSPSHVKLQRPSLVRLPSGS